MKIVRGQALAQTIATTGPGLIQQTYILEEVSLREWYDEVIFYLLNHRCPPQLNPIQKRALQMKSQKYMLQGAVLYKKNHEGIYLRCVGREEAKQIMEQFHGRSGTSHEGCLATTHQIARAGYYWSTLFKDAYQHVKACHTC